MLSTELTAEEIIELRKFQESPLAAKMRTLQSRLAPEIGIETSKSMIAFSCATAKVGLALRGEDASNVFAGDQISESYASRVAEYADLATSYCFCRARWESDAARGITRSTAPKCDEPPEFAPSR